MKIAVLFVAISVGVASGRIVDPHVNAVDALEVCYDHLGCFDKKSPWTHWRHRPLGALPDPPHEVGTRFILFSRGGGSDNQDYGYELMPGKEAVLKWSDFQPERKTYFLIHGFTDDHRVKWMWDTKNLLLKNEDANIISVDWAPGASGILSYLKATANARVVGAQIARMITFLEQYGKMNIDDVHIISHSLGAHVAGYAGERLLGRIPRITAIDPMHLYFANTDPVVRLDASDAKFVEVIHSNTNEWDNLGLGLSEAIGHVDLYPNGGTKQPGCKDKLGKLVSSLIKLVTLNFDGAISTWACSHTRAAHFYAESISQKDACPFISFQCKNYNDFQKGNCYQACNNQGNCVSLGYNSKNHQHASGIYYLQTTDGSNENGTYCKQIVQVQVPVSVTHKQTSGSLTLAFRGADGTLSERFTLVDSSRISPGQLIQRWVEVPNHILRRADEKVELVLRFSRGFLQPNTVQIDGVFANVIKPDLTSQQTLYQGATLESGMDVPVNA